jgi:ubiquinone/menaquinone biosynthesis C-methylase UbiE
MARIHTRHLATGFIGLGLTIGMSGVPMAQLGGRPAESWITMLERPDRVAGLKVDEIVARLDLKPGQVVADIGAGPGIFSLALAKAVGPTGKVYAEDVDQAFIDHIKQKLQEQHVTNVQPILGVFTDPKLPAADVDVAFFHDVLHHVEDRPGFLKALAPSVKAAGRIAIIEYDAVNGPHKAAPALQVTKEQLDAWMADIGFKPIQRIDDLFTDTRWFVIYGRK